MDLPPSPETKFVFTPQPSFFLSFFLSVTQGRIGGSGRSGLVLIFLINTRESNNVIQRMPRRHRVSRLPESKEAGRVGWGEGEGRHGEFIHPGSGDLVTLDPIMTR